MTRARARSALAAVTVAAAVAASSAPGSGAVGRSGDPCGRLPHGSTPVHLDPADFTTRIDHPYWPMRPGTVWHLVEKDDGETQRVTITVTRDTTLIAGIEARIVHDVVRAGGRVVEDTLDWYAQDTTGSIWYLGEDTRAYDEDGSVSTEGSWQHGVDGAFAGVLLPARPRPGCSYREEYRSGEAEDRAVVLALSEAVTVPAGSFRRLLHTANTTPLEPTLLENKFYARGVGPVLEVDLSPSFSSAVLVRLERDHQP